MKIVILPGFSSKNNEWLNQTRESLSTQHEVHAITWPHWETQNNEDFSVEKEAEKIKELVGNQSFHIVAKSVGTLVAMYLIKDLSFQVQKVTICGLPFEDLDDKDKDMYKNLGQISANQIIVFQNENDHHGSFLTVSSFLKTINNKIQVISKPRDDHEYPYFEEFEKFLG